MQIGNRKTAVYRGILLIGGPETCLFLISDLFAGRAYLQGRNIFILLICRFDFAVWQSA